MDQDLDTLVNELRKGNDVFEQLLSALQQTVYSFGLKVCGQVEDAQDTMQETLLTAFQSLPNLDFRNGRALKVWLYKVAKNACLMKRRKSKFEPGTSLSLDALIDGSGSVGAQIADGAELPLEHVLQAERKGLLRDAVLKLPERYRVVLVLRDMEQLSTEEVSDVLALKPETVKVRLHRARQSLRRELEAGNHGVTHP